MQNVRQQVLDKCNEVKALALKHYGVDLSDVPVHIDVKGRVAGWACRKFGQYKVRLNADMITRGDPEVLKDMLEDTIPHEFGHIVCFKRPELGKNHDQGWRRVCLTLGGTGKRTHDNEVVYGKGATYEYTTDRGNKVRMGEKHHQRVQMGFPLRYKRGLGTVTKGCAYSIVGLQGRTLQQPIVRNSEHKPAVQPAIRMTINGVNSPDALQAWAREQLARAHALQKKPVDPPVIDNTSNSVKDLYGGYHATKADAARAVMRAEYAKGSDYETILFAVMKVTGHARQLAKSYVKNNLARCGIPASFC